MSLFCKSKNKDAACFHIKPVDRRLFNAVRKKAAHSVYNAVSFFRASSWNTQHATLFIHNNDVVITIKYFYAKHFRQHDAASLITRFIFFTGNFILCILTIEYFTHAQRNKMVYKAVIKQFWRAAIACSCWR